MRFYVILQMPIIPSCDLYYRFREATRTPKTISAIHCDLGISKQELIDFVAVCTRAEKGNANLIKARYHFFVRALEGASSVKAVKLSGVQI